MAPELSGSSWGCFDVFPAGLAPGVFPVAREGAVSTPSTEARALGLMNLWQGWEKSDLNPAPLTLSPSRNGLDWASSLLEMPSPWPSQTSECADKDRAGIKAWEVLLYSAEGAAPAVRAHRCPLPTSEGPEEGWPLSPACAEWPMAVQFYL